MSLDRQRLTIPELLVATVRRRADQPALGLIEQGRLRWLTWEEVVRDVSRWSRALYTFKVQAGERVAHIAPNSYSWVLADLAIQLAGAVHVPLHASLSIAQQAEQTRHCEASLAITETNDQSRELQRVVEIPVRSHADLIADAEQQGANVEQLVEDAARIAPTDLATVLYTSGTSGQPRGVMLSQHNLAWNAVAVSDAVAPDADETRLAFLPFSHIYARTCDLGSWLYRGTRLVLAESRDTILRDCQLAQPTTLNGVPYFYQKVTDRLRASSEECNAKQLRAAFGGSVRRLSCGGAPLSPETEAFYQQRGLPVLSGYGLTEASPVITATAPDQYTPSTVGRPLPEVELCLADDGEILCRSPGVMQGYWRGETATAEAIVDGWLATGDLGEWQGENLRICGRKKEVIVLATGKNVAPAKLESLLTGSPLIEQAIIIGNGRNYLTALLVPNPERLRAEIRERRLWVWSKRRAVSHPRIVELFQAEVKRCLANEAHHEQVGRFTVVSRGFSVELGELTPKMSLKRAAIQQNFQQTIERMYQ